MCDLRILVFLCTKLRQKWQDSVNAAAESAQRNVLIYKIHNLPTSLNKYEPTGRPTGKAAQQIWKCQRVGRV